MKGRLIQLGSSMILSIVIAMASFANVWPSYAIPMLKSDKSPLGFKITDNEANIISSLPMIGSLIATLLAGYVTESFGRKKTQILCGLMILVAWSLIVTARTTIQTMIGRFANGLSAGTAVVSVMIYVSEISDLSNRSRCTSIVTLFFNIGILMSYLEGWFFSYDVICYASLSAAVLYVIMMCFLKESPSYLLKIGQEKEALRALKFYRGVSETSDSILEELAYMKYQVAPAVDDSPDAEKPMLDNDKTHEKRNIDEHTKKRNPIVVLVTEDYNRRAIIMTILFTVLSVSMGMISVQTYANQIFAEAVPNVSSSLCSVLLAFITIFSSCAATLFSDLVSRRALMISTCFISTVCLATLGASMRFPWVPIWLAPVAILLYCIAFHVGVINIVFIQMTESFGPQVNSASTPITLCSLFGTNFLVLYLFGPTVAYFGIDGTFFLFAFNGAIITILSIFFQKETRRVPVEDIQRMYSKGFLYRKL